MDEYWLRLKELRRLLKIEWAELWKTKYDDEVKAEGVSIKEFEKLYVDRGEIIHATRDYRPLNFKEIFEKHVGVEDAAKVDVNSKVGGWGKFARKNFPAKRSKRERPTIKVALSQHQRKDGVGWLNKAKIWRKIRLSRIED